MQIMRADDAAADFAEDVAAGDTRDIELAGQFVDRRGMQEHRVERDIEHEHDQRSRQHRARQVTFRHAHLADDIGRRIPARERIHHEHKTDGERRAGDHGEVGGVRRERDRLRRADDKSRDQERNDQHDLEDGRHQLKAAGVPDPGQLHETTPARPRRRQAPAAARPAAPTCRIARRPWRRAPPGPRNRPSPTPSLPEIRTPDGRSGSGNCIRRSSAETSRRVRRRKTRRRARRRRRPSIAAGSRSPTGCP